MFVPSVWAEQPSEIDTMHHLTSGSLSAQRGSILLLLKKMRKYITVCAWKCLFFFLLPSARSTRWFDTECRKLLLWIISISFLILWFYKSSHSSFNSSDLICCQTHANCEALEYEQKALWAAVGVWKKKKKWTAFFRNAIIPPPSVFAVTGMFRFYRLFFLPLHWLCACICVSCSVFCFSSPSTTANELISITSLKKLVILTSKLLLNHASYSVLQYCAVQ